MKNLEKDYGVEELTTNVMYNYNGGSVIAFTIGFIVGLVGVLAAIGSQK